MAITLSYTFSPNTTISSSQVNANFSTLATRALDKTGDTLTGTLTSRDVVPSSSATYDLGSSSFKFRDAYFSRNMTIGGTLGVTGLITATAGITLTGGQIAFPASQNASADANTLDDYEEGTWTMAAKFGGASVGQTTSSNTGRYTKIGDRILVSGQLQLTAKGSSTGEATIATLPFAVRAGAAASCPIYMSTVTFADWPNAVFAQATSTIVLAETTNAGTQTTLTHADFADTSLMVVGGGYGV